MNQVRLIIADDHLLMREGLCSLLKSEDRFSIVGEADNGQQAVELAHKLMPHLVVMDVSMPDLNGIEATRQILDENPNIKIVALSGHSNMVFVREILEAGASAYVLKSRAYEDLIRAVDEVMAGRKYLTPDIASGVVSEYVEMSSSSQKDPAFVMLTPRERQVLQQLAEGRSTKEMADTLSVSVKTVETHRRNIMEKLELHTVADLTKYAVREGLTTLDG
ncbi:MAG TPA: response regulator transcription factor [Tichowtungia sp.]|nr:response regulator transcription factor [Tichowtungia sp.]